MSEWSRPNSERPERLDSIEVTLVDSSESGRRHRAPRQVATGTPDARHHGKRTALIVLGAAGAIAIGAVTIVAVGGTDDEPSSTATTLDPFQLADSITTPPVLEPLETLPPAPVPTTVPVSPPGITVPEFDVVPGTNGVDLAAYDLAAAVAANSRSDQPRRTTYQIVGLHAQDTSSSGRTPDEVTKKVTIASDPRTGRDAMSMMFLGLESETVVDRGGATLYQASRATGSDKWYAIEEPVALVGTNSSSLSELFDLLAAGPITPELVAASEVTAADELVRLPGGVFARRYDLALPIGDVPAFGALTFADLSVYEVAAGGAPQALTFQVYVTDQPELALVTSSFVVDGQPLGFTQLFDRRPANVRIALPEQHQLIVDA